MKFNKNHIKKVTPYLWFDNNADEAINFYKDLFKENIKVDNLNHYPSGPLEGKVQSATFKIFNQDFCAFDGGPMYKFTEAISFFISCEDQDEINYYWEKITSNGGEEQACGWIKDKFGLTWQIAPAIIEELLSDPVKSAKVFPVMMEMKKLDIAKLKAAAE